MRAGAVSAAALTAQGQTTPPLVPHHCCEEVYFQFVQTLAAVTPAYRRQLLAWRQRFVARWPECDLSDRFAAIVS